MSKIMDDVRYLAGALPHRESQTDEEDAAGRHIESRLRETFEDVSVEAFGAVDNFPLLTASYLGEYAVVGVLAVWWPLASAVYGVAVSLAFLAEWSGRPVFSRLLPHYESANIVACYQSPEPLLTVVVTARHDSGPATLLTHPAVAPKLGMIYLALLLAMALVIGASAAEGIAGLRGLAIPWAPWLRWCAVAALLAGAVLHFIAAGWNADVPGGNGNASGVAALLRLGEMLAEEPPRHVDVWLAATGAHSRGMAGMRALLAESGLDRHETQIINLESVGAGRLCHTTAEGMPLPAATGAALRAAAGKSAGAHGFAPARLTRVSTETQAALSRGWNAMSLVGIGPQGVPCHWHWVTDTAGVVDEAKVEAAAAFARAIIANLETGGEC